MTAPRTIRDRKRQAVRDQVATVAVELFAERGYESTTVEQIAAAAGLSTRSFFRYFSSKDAVITHAFDTAGAGVASALTERPCDEPPWVALRRAFDGLLDQMVHNESSLRVMRMIYDTPALYASHLRKQARWQELIGAALAPRLDDGDGDEASRHVRASSLAGAAVSCLEAARLEWVASSGGSALGTLLDTAMDAVSPLPRAVMDV